jgi:N4-gp56 family major capsid protein
MAFTEFGTASAQAVKRWSDMAMVETFGKMGIRPLIGRGANSCIQLKTELDKNPGDTIYYDLRAQDRGTGVSGDTVLQGYEDALTFYQDTLKINYKRKAHAFKNMSQQRTVHDLREHGRDSLTEWMAWFMEGGLIAHLAGLCGNGNESVVSALGADTASADFAGNTITALDAAHLVDNAGNDFDLAMLESAVAKAKVNNPRVPPLKINGADKYIALLHPYQVRSMRSDAGTAQWRDITANAGVRGENNPLYTGALGEYNGVILRESEFIPRSSDVTTGLLLGKCAGTIAFGNAWETMSRGTTDGSFFKIIEDKFDYEHQKGMAASTCVGFKRAQFNSAAFGVVGLRSTEAAPS